MVTVIARKRVLNRAALLSAGLLWVGFASAQQAAATYELGVGVRGSDNIERAENGSSGATGTLGILLNAERETGTLQYKSDADLDYLHYFNQSFSNELLGQFNAKASYSFLPQTLVWVVDEHFGQVTNDYFQSPGPQNRQYLNVFSTGPDVRLRLANALQLRLSGRYGRDDYQTSPYSATRVSGEAAFERRPSAAALLSLGGGHERLTYQQTAAQPGNFAVNRYFAGYQLAGAHTAINIQGGYSQSSGGLVQLRGATGFVELDRKVGSASRLRLGARRALNTVALGSRAADFLPGVVGLARPEVLTGTLFFSDSVDLSYNWKRPRNELDLVAAVGRETDHRDIRPDRDIQAVGAKFSHRLTPLADAGLYARWGRDTAYNVQLPGFPPGDFHSREFGYGLLFRLRFSRLLVTSLDLTHTERVADIASYRENAAWLRLAYAPAPLPRPAEPAK
jgi:hypothetical protein